MPVDAIKVDRQIPMDPISFQRATDKILQISHGELKRLSEILRTHPDIHILIKGHTDNFGDIPALTALSYRRAQAVKEFLMNEKINENRDRKSTRLNSSHVAISYAVFCLKKKKI